MKSKAEFRKKLVAYWPYLALFFLTTTLMFIFYDNNSSTETFRKGKNALLNFYTDNLMPMFYRTEVNNEDIFNFAVYNTFPIDKKENKVLKIKEDDNGSTVFQVENSGYNPESKNYANFLNSVKIDNSSKEGLDSLLESYKEDIYTNILVNDNKTYAVNPKIEILRKTLVSDIYEYVIQNSELKNVATGIAGLKYQDSEISRLKNIYANELEDSYTNLIMFGPDTIFSTFANVNNNSIIRQAREFEKQKTGYYQVAPVTGVANQASYIRTFQIPPEPGEFNIRINNKDALAYIPKSEMEDKFKLNLPALDNLEENFKNFAISMAADSNNYIRFSYSVGEDSSKAFSLSIGGASKAESATAVSVGSQPGEKNNSDSVSTNFNMEANDSVFSIETTGFKMRFKNPDKNKKSNK